MAENLTEVFTTRLSESEAAALKRLAGDESPSAFLRRLVRQATAAPKLSPVTGRSVSRASLPVGTFTCNSRDMVSVGIKPGIVLDSPSPAAWS